MIKQFLISVVLIGALVACSDDDSKLEGKWQMQQMEVNGEVMPVDTIYYNFQNKLFMFQVANGVNDVYAYGYKTLEDDKKVVLEIDPEKNDVNAFLQKSGWETNPCIFSINKLSHSKLILQHNDKIYTFRKF